MFNGTHNINFGFLLALHGTFPSPVKKISQAYYSGGIQTHDPYNSRAVSYQLDNQDCPVARGSLNSIGTHNDETLAIIWTDSQIKVKLYFG